MRKAIDFISLVSAVLTLTMSGGLIYSYLYIKNPDNQEKTKAFDSLRVSRSRILGFRLEAAGLGSFRQRRRPTTRENPGIQAVGSWARQL